MALVMLNPDMPSSPSRGTWIEIVEGNNVAQANSSSPSRGTWIEIQALLGRQN